MARRWQGAPLPPLATKCQGAPLATICFTLIKKTSRAGRLVPKWADLLFAHRPEGAGRDGVHQEHSLGRESSVCRDPCGNIRRKYGIFSYHEGSGASPKLHIAWHRCPDQLAGDSELMEAKRRVFGHAHVRPSFVGEYCACRHTTSVNLYVLPFLLNFPCRRGEEPNITAAIGRDGCPLAKDLGKRAVHVRCCTTNNSNSKQRNKHETKHNSLLQRTIWLLLYISPRKRKGDAGKISDAKGA